MNTSLTSEERPRNPNIDPITAPIIVPIPKVKIEPIIAPTTINAYPVFSLSNSESANFMAPFIESTNSTFCILFSTRIFLIGRWIIFNLLNSFCIAISKVFIWLLTALEMKTPPSVACAFIFSAVCFKVTLRPTCMNFCKLSKSGLRKISFSNPFFVSAAILSKF